VISVASVFEDIFVPSTQNAEPLRFFNTEDTEDTE
jgi:hypothetical protein